MFLHSSRLLYSSICIYFHLSVFFHIFLCFLSISLPPYVFLSRSLTSLTLYYSSVLLALRTSFSYRQTCCTSIVSLYLNCHSIFISPLLNIDLKWTRIGSTAKPFFSRSRFFDRQDSIKFRSSRDSIRKKRALKKETHSHFWSSLFWSAASLSSIKIGTVGGRPISAVIMPLIAWLIVGRSIRRN